MTYGGLAGRDLEAMAQGFAEVLHEDYLQYRIRSVEIGSVMFGGPGRPPPPMELVRLAIPRRVYTQSHIDYVAEAMQHLFERRSTLRGLRIVNEPPTLRHFTARFGEV